MPDITTQAARPRSPKLDGARAVAIVIAVPLLLLWAVTLGVEKLESDWRAAVQEQYPEATAAQLANVRLEFVCQDPQVRAQVSACLDVEIAHTVQTLLLIACAVSVVMLLVVGGAARFAGGDRRRMAQVFRPSLTLLEIGMVVVILFEGAALTDASYLLPAAYLGSYLLPIPLIFGATALLAAYGVGRAVILIGRKVPASIDGVTLRASDQPRLFAFVGDVARELGTEPPAVIVAGFDPTFFVTEDEARTLDGPTTGRLLYLSLPFIRILSHGELTAVIGHELAHFRGEDTLYSRRFAPGYRSAVQAVVGVAKSGGRLGMSMVRPTMRVVMFFVSTFATGERAISRQRELEADTAAASITTPSTIATTLVKLHAFGTLWNDVLMRTLRDVGLGRQVGNPTVVFAARAASGSPLGRVADLEDSTLAHPTDSHPPLKVRLDHLGMTSPTLFNQALEEQVQDPAIDLIDRPDDVEARMTASLAARFNVVGWPAAVSRDPEAVLRAGAASDPVVARVVDLFDRLRGGNLYRGFDLRVDHLVLASLAVAPIPQARAFTSIVRFDRLPPGRQLQVTGFATDATPQNQILSAGARLRPVGVNSASERLAGTIMNYLVSHDQLIVVQGVGTTADLASQLAGLFVMPVSEVPSVRGGAFDAAVEGLAAPLRQWQELRDTHAASESRGVADKISKLRSSDSPQARRNRRLPVTTTGDEGGGSGVDRSGTSYSRSECATVIGTRGVGGPCRPVEPDQA